MNYRWINDRGTVAGFGIKKGTVTISMIGFQLSGAGCEGEEFQTQFM